MNVKRVSDVGEFKALLAAGKRDFVILLGGGLVSRKHIVPLKDGRFEVFHGITGHCETLCERDLLGRRNIGKALLLGAFGCEE